MSRFYLRLLMSAWANIIPGIRFGIPKMQAQRAYLRIRRFCISLIAIWPIAARNHSIAAIHPVNMGCLASWGRLWANDEVTATTIASPDLDQPHRLLLLLSWQPCSRAREPFHVRD